MIIRDKHDLSIVFHRLLLVFLITTIFSFHHTNVTAISSLPPTSSSAITTTTLPTTLSADNDIFHDDSLDTISGNEGTFISPGENRYLFTKPYYNVSIAENSFGKMYANCLDEKMGIYMSDKSLVVRYKIIAGDDNKIFKAESRHVGDFYFLRIRTRSGDNVILNREYRSRYELQVRATITSLNHDLPHAIRLKSRCVVYVNIEDKNDLSPIFYPEQYEVTVAEDIPIDSSIISVSAYDPDIGLNGQIYYTLAENSLTFAVHPTRGVISVTRPLSSDHGHSKYHHLTILARDRGNHANSREILDTSKAKLTIRVIPVNKYSPKITFKHHSSFRSQKKTIYGVAHVTDADEGIFGDICSVQIIAGDEMKLFAITNSSANDYYIEHVSMYSNNNNMTNVSEATTTISKYNLTLLATDCGNASTSQSISIILNSAIVFLPRFDSDHYYEQLHEVSLIGTQVIKLTAFIPHTHEEYNNNHHVNNNIVYRIIAGNYRDTFDISSNGVVFTRKLLDYELKASFTLTISAHISSSPARYVTTELKITLIDDNDNSPVLDEDKSGSISVAFNENSPEDSLVYRVSASDADSGDNGMISYTFAHHPVGPFSIDHANGEIKTTQKLDFESGPQHYHLLILASDWGEPFRRQIQILLNFTLKDVNDHRPQFEKSNCSAYIPLNTKPMTEIMTLSAIDFDEGTTVTYKMSGSAIEDCFSLNENTGILRLTCNLIKAAALIDNKTINVSATDGHYWSDVMPIKIVIIGHDNNNNNDNHNSAHSSSPLHETHNKRQHNLRDSLVVDCNGVEIAQKFTMLMHSKQLSHNLILEEEESELHRTIITKENLHNPEFDVTTPKEIYLAENAKIGSKILTLIATDEDNGFEGMLVWSISSQTAKSNTNHNHNHNHTNNNNINNNSRIVFKVDPFTGELFVIDSIDYEQHSKYKLHLIVCDLGTPQLCASHLMYIIIEDVNDNSPIIENYEFNVPEDSPVGHIIGYVHAVDFDHGQNSHVAYGFLNHNNEDIFAIDPKNGSIYIKQTIDREVNDKYVLYVSVHDFGKPSLTSSSTVTINIIDINDNAPTFYHNYYIAKVREDQPVGSIIMKITAFDADEGKSAKIHYSINSEIFTIDEMMGNIRINRELDFEKMQLYNVTIMATDEGMPPLSSSAFLIIEVEDVNENYFPPKFPDFIVISSVKENSAIGTLVTNVSAYDEDSDLPCIYSIIGGDGLGRFTINEHGNIFTSSVLDREIQSQYWLTVMAKDRSAVPLTAHCEVYVEVINENDVAPLTKQPFYYASVAENASIDTPLIQIESYDSDAENDGLINYRITNDVPFVIDKTNGLIRTKNKLDAETQSYYVIDVEVSETTGDKVQTTLLSRSPVMVSVIDVNEFDPTAISSMQRCQAYNSLPTSIPICQMLVIDRDASKGKDCELDFRLIEGNEFNWFNIDHESGVIYFNKQSVPSGEYELILTVLDCGSPKRSAHMRTTLRVLPPNKSRDSNEPPQVNSFDSDIELNENQDIGFIVLQLNVTDIDNDELAYHITSGNIGNTFTIANGSLILAKHLDYESTDYFNLTIMVTDGINSTYDNVTIRVIDVNDNKVAFIQDSYSVNVLENITVGSEVVQLNAVDLDISDHLLFTIYSTHTKDSLKLFEIESSTGKIRVKEPLDHELSRLHLLVIELSNFPSKSTNERAFAKVVINILDVNDQPPLFISSEFEANIVETASIGTSIMQLDVLDGDIGVNAQIEYSIISGNIGNAFDIHSQLGFIFLSKPVNARQQPEYYLIVKATNKGFPPLSSTANVHINVRIPDNSPPQFEKKLHHLHVKENAKTGTVITLLKAFSMQSLYYEIINGNQPKNKFAVNVNNGELWLRDGLDYEVEKRYDLTVRAMNMVGMNDSSRVIISVLDVNDVTPYWNQTSFTGYILESESKGSTVLTQHNLPLIVKAYDDDSTNNAMLTYSIVEETARLYFDINPSTGVISLAQQIDYEKTREFHFRVSVFDNGLPSLKAAVDAFVHVIVLPVNDCPPQLSLTEYHALILLPTLKDVIIATITANDCDDNLYENSNDLKFSLTHVNTNTQDKFAINSTSGVIVTLKSEIEEGNYDILVSVTDGVFNSEANMTITAQKMHKSSLRFTSDKFVGHILENNNDVKTLVIPTIIGSKMNEHLSYRILNPTNIFRISRTSGAIISRGISVDRELTPKFELLLEVRSLFSKNRIAHCIVEIIVDDVNDNRPTFLGLPYYFTVDVESQPDTTIVGKLNAVDPDMGLNGLISFSFVTGDYNGLFKIDIESGEISLARSVMANDSEMIRLVVKSRDSGFPSLESQANVTIKLVSKPIFEEQQYTVAVAENQPLNVAFLHVKALSPHKRQIIYNIIEGNENNVFSLDFNSGMLAIIKKLDRESISTYNLLVSATDSVDGVSSNVPVAITVTDINDNPPLFSQSSYNISLSELSPIGTSVIQVEATDKDLGINAALIYKLIGNESHFYITSSDGIIYLKTPLDHETSISHHFDVVVTDQGSPQLSSTANINVNVISHSYKEINPISFIGNSYAHFGITKNVRKISMRLRTQQIRAIIFYQIGLKGLSILEIAGGFIQYRFDCGNGEGLIRVENILVNDGKWHEIIIERKPNSATLTLDTKYRGNGFAPRSSWDCASFDSGNIYFGGEIKPRPATVGGEDINFGLIGCLDNILLDDFHLPLHSTQITPHLNVAVLKLLTNIKLDCNFKIDVGACKSQPCLNGGSCHNLDHDGSYQCQCANNRFTGKNCEIDLNPCASMPCLNNGKCFNDEYLCKKGVKNCYKCECVSDFSGFNCQVARFCTNQLCQNNGICQESLIGPKCSCHPGWHGTYCQYDIDECKLPTPVCPSLATCINLQGSFHCICPPNITDSFCKASLYATNILSTPLNITLDEIIGIVIALAILLFSGCIIACCWSCKNKSRNNRTPNNHRDANEFLLKNHTRNDINVNLKRFSKISNYEMTNSPVNGMGLLPANRPTSFIETLNNFDNLETSPCVEFMQNLKKNPNLSPLTNASSSTSTKAFARNQEKIQNDAKSPSCKSSNNRASYCDSDVFNEENSNTLSNSHNSNNAEGYHWDCSDWATNGASKPIANILEVSVNEIHDSETNSDNSQTELSTSTNTNLCHEHDKTMTNNDEHDSQQHERSTLLTLNDEMDEIEFADKSTPTSPQRYLDMYLPRHHESDWNNDHKRKATILEEEDDDCNEECNDECKSEDTNENVKATSSKENLRVTVYNFEHDHDQDDDIESTINACESETDIDYDGEEDYIRESTYV